MLGNSNYISNVYLFFLAVSLPITKLSPNWIDEFVFPSNTFFGKNWNKFDGISFITFLMLWNVQWHTIKKNHSNFLIFHSIESCFLTWYFIVFIGHRLTVWVNWEFPLKVWVWVWILPSAHSTKMTEHRNSIGIYKFSKYFNVIVCESMSNDFPRLYYEHP